MPPREYYIAGDNDYVVGRSPMICGSYEAEIRKYHKFIGKSGKIWLIADEPNCADHIYVEGGEKSRGFGGRTLKFPISGSDEVVELKGPWHSNGEAFTNETGVDISDRYLTHVVIGKEVKYGKSYETIVCDVVYKDEEPQIGSFHRGDILGREWAQKLGHRVFVVTDTQGGGSRGYVDIGISFYWEREHEPVDASPMQSAIILR